jgi:HisA/HisF family protein
MLLIPVVDLMHGQVVRARRGDRRSYQPIVSTLCDGSAPLDIACALVAHCDARCLYLADLDALQGRTIQAAVLRELLHALPGVELWVDAGFADAAAARSLQEELGDAAARLRPIFGSESLRSAAELDDCFGPRRSAGPNALLSLDRRDGTRLDAAGCWDTPARWSSPLIVMTLERVGADSGPDLDTLREVQARSPGTPLVGAGGIRDGADLERAAVAGAWGWLVASALHDGRIAAAHR